LGVQVLEFLRTCNCAQNNSNTATKSPSAVSSPTKSAHKLARGAALPLLLQTADVVLLPSGLYVGVCVFVFVCVCVCFFVCALRYMCRRVYVCVRVFIFVYLCMHGAVDVCVYICMCIWVYLCMVRVCMRIDIWH